MSAIDRIVPHRSFEVVAAQLRRQIALRVLGASGLLPPERELASRFHVGRATVQRALRVLEAEGLIERRRGRTGGTFVVRAEEGQVASALLQSIRDRAVEIEEALAFRLALDPVVAARAASTRSANDLAAIGAAAARAAPGVGDEAFMEADTAFHLAVARAAANRFFLDGVERVRVVLNDALVALPDSPEWHAWSKTEHELIAEAISAGDAERAAALALAHAQRTDAAVRTLLRTLA